MRLKHGPKLAQNLMILQACSRARVIELTERRAELEEQQIKLIEASPMLQTFLSKIYHEQQANEDIQIANPNAHQLISTSLRNYHDFDADKDFAPIFKQYHYNYRVIQGMSRTLDDHTNLNELLEQDKVSLRKVNAFLDDTDHSKAFQSFSTNMRSHPAFILGLKYRQKADAIAEKHGIANTTYYSKSKKAFSTNDISLSLDNDFKGRLKSAGTKLLLGLALSASIAGIFIGMNKNDTTHTQGTTETHISGPQVPGYSTTENPIVTSPDTHENDLNIFRNSFNINSYESACKDYFEKISDVYKYNTGEEINLSGYGQENIGVNQSAPILVIEYNGQTYRFSGQSQHASNYRHLKEAFDALGVDYSETSSRISYIIDDTDSSKSIAIVDSQGNPVRSGNVITGSNRAYNSEYVRQGRSILEGQGKDASSLSEAECVAAFLLSDKYDDQNPELSIALGEVSNLTYTIKTTFYEEDGKSDPYAVYLYSQDSEEFAENFEARAQEQVRLDNDVPSREDR